MKKFSTLIIIFIFFVGIFLPSGIVHGQAKYTDNASCVAYVTSQGISPLSAKTQCDQQFPPNGQNVNGTTTLGTCSFGNGIPESQNQTESGCKTNGGSWTENPNPANTKAPETACGLSFSKGIELSGCLTSILMSVLYFIMTLTAWLLWLAGQLLNFVLEQTIVNMAGNLSTMTGINIAWKVIRDVINICFIFILVYQGIKLILSQIDTSQAQKIVTGVIITALLVNFSVFFTKIIIDASNIATVGFYNNIAGAQQTIPGPADSTTPSGGPVTYSIHNGISGSFAYALHITSLYNTTSATSITDTGKIAVFVLGSILFLVLAFVFFAVSIMFIIRYIVLIFLIMFSPIGFVGWSNIPGISGLQGKWWDTLIGQCIFAPLYMFMTWVILTLISSPGFIPTGGSLAGIAAPSGVTNGVTQATAQMGAIAIIVNFAVIIGLVVLSLSLSKSQASKGYSMVSTATGKLTTFAGGAVMGTAAWAGRKSFGAIGNAAADSASLQVAANKERKGVFDRAAGASARLALYASKKARSGSFDVRSATIPTNVIGDAIGGTIGRTGVGKKLGLNNVNVPGIEIGAMVAKQTGVGAGGTKGYKETRAESQKQINDREAAAASEYKLAEAKKAIAKGAKADPTTPDGVTAIAEMEKALSKLSTKEIETIVAGNRDLLNSLNFANKISVQQLEALNKSDQFSENEKGKLKNNRFKQMDDLNDTAGLAAIALRLAGTRPLTTEEIAAEDRVKKARDRVKALADSELEMIDSNYLDPKTPEGIEFISQLKQGQVDAINKSSKFTSAQKDSIKVEKMRPLKAALNAGNVAKVQSIIRKANAKTLAGYLGENISLTNTNKIGLDPAVLPVYKVKTLQNIAALDTISAEDISKLRTALLGPEPPGAGMPGADPATVAWLNDKTKGGIEFPL